MNYSDKKRQKIAAYYILSILNKVNGGGKLVKALDFILNNFV